MKTPNDTPWIDALTTLTLLTIGFAGGFIIGLIW